MVALNVVCEWWALRMPLWTVRGAVRETFGVKVSRDKGGDTLLIIAIGTRISLTPFLPRRGALGPSRMRSVERVRRIAPVAARLAPT